MSQSTTATLDLPRPARRPALLPAPVLTAVAVLLLAHVPILLAHMHVLSMKPHYEFYPLVFVGAAVLAAPAYRLVRAGRPDGGWARPAAAVWRAGLALLAANALILTAAAVLDSPWLGMVSFWELVAAVAVLAGGWPALRATVPALIFLLLIVPPPFKLDARLVTSLQAVTSRAGSRVLDYVPVLHYLDGNTVEVGEKKYFVDRACSGINSLFSTLAVTLFCALWVRAHWLRTALLLLAAVFWVLVANVVRVSLIVWLDRQFGIDLSKDGWDWDKGCFYQHTALGFALFGLVLALMYSTNQFLMFLGTAVRWGADDARADAPPAADLVPARPPGWAAVAPVLAVYGLLLAFQVGEYQLGSRGFGETDLVKGYNAWTVNDLPEQIGPWKREAESTFESRDRDNQFGAHSRTWRYQTKSGLTAVVSFDYPFPEWHDLRVCYKGIGWLVNRTDTFTHAPPRAGQPAGADALACMKFEMSKPFKHRGYAWFTEFDQAGKPVPIQEGEVERGFQSQRLAERMEDLRDRWLSLVRGTPVPPRHFDVLQVQVLVERYGDLADAERQQVEQLFTQAAELVRAKCVASLPAGPAS